MSSNVAPNLVARTSSASSVAAAPRAAITRRKGAF
jgi:hypothetical protein